MSKEINNNQKYYEEIDAKSMNGMGMLLLNTLLMIASVGVIIIGGIMLDDYNSNHVIGGLLLVVGILYIFLIGPMLYAGLRIIRPNEAAVLTFFGKYYGTIRKEGFYYINPFARSFNPSASVIAATTAVLEGAKATTQNNIPNLSRKISLKTMTLNNDKQKINDQLGNPIVIGIVVIWKVVNPTQAVFNVDNYKEFLSIQCDSALRNIVRLYPYDSSNEDNEKSLRGSSQEIADNLKDEIQSKVKIAGLEIIEARITHLSYAQEIAAVMLQRQQASAIIDARQMIVEGAVGMVDMALKKLSESDMVNLDEERKAAMVSNLLVVLCGNKETQPIVNSGSLY